MPIQVGVLAIQGSFAKHAEKLQEIGTKALLVKSIDDLQQCKGLIIPGGESTTLTKQLKEAGLYDAIQQFAVNHAIFGTCAGAILLSSDIENPGGACSLGIMDYTIRRNAFGRQNDSSEECIQVKIEDKMHECAGIFIRAPKFTSVGPKVSSLAFCPSKGHILLQQGRHLAATFHPELTSSSLLHKYFVKALVTQSTPQTLMRSL